MSSELAAYRKHCRDVVRDIDFVIADYKQRCAGWTIHYAVDFSEIHGFTEPFKDFKTAVSLSESWQDDPLRQFHGITRFFHERKIVLLEPYAVELHTYMEELLSTSYDKSAELVLDASLTDLLTFAGKKTDVLTGVTRYLQRSHLQKDEVDEVIRIYEEQAPALVAYVRGVRLKPLTKLKQLLKRRPFIDLEELAPEVPANVSLPNVDVLKNSFAEKRNHTPRTTDVHDAEALDQIRIANEKLKAQKRMILLVSRGRHMFEVLDASKPLGFNEPFVRHPRIFSRAYQPEGGINDAVIDDLERRRDSLRLFIAAADNPVLSDEEGMRLRQSLEAIKVQWSNAESLGTAFAEEGEGDLLPDGSETDDKHQLALDLLNFLRDESRGIRASAIRHIHQVLREMRLERDFLSATIESAAAPTQLGNVLYVIEFTNPELRTQMEELAETWSVGVEDAAKLIYKATDSKDEYEQLLAMAVSLGIIGRWPTAEKYAAYALEAGNPETDTEKPKRSLHEGHFWHAICLRKNTQKNAKVEQSVERIDSAIKKIDLATEDRRKALGDAPDPRYLKEAAALAIEWRQIALRDLALLEKAPKPDEIEDKLATALDATKDPKLIVQIRNAACYLYLNENNASKARESLALLNESLAPYEVVPSFIRDTRLWGQFLLSREERESKDALVDREKIIDDLRGILTDFEQIRDSSDLTPFEKELVQEHRNAVANELRDRKANLKMIVGLP